MDDQFVTLYQRRLCVFHYKREKLVMKKKIILNTNRIHAYYIAQRNIISISIPDLGKGYYWY